MDGQLKRKWENPTSWTVGAVILDDDNKPKGMPLGPGESIWLTAAEERLTAEAPRLAANNPFVKEWECPIDFNSAGEPIAHETRKGVLVLSNEPPRTITSSRFIPASDPTPAAPAAETNAATGEEAGQEAGEEGAEEQKKDDDPTEHTGAPPLPKQPPVHGQPAPDEQVATPGAVPANDEYLAKQKREELEQLETSELADQHARLADDDPARTIAAEILRERATAGGGDGERRVSVEEIAESGPKGPEEIGTRREAPAIV